MLWAYHSTVFIKEDEDPLCLTSPLISMRTFRNQKHMAKFPQHLGKQTETWLLIWTFSVHCLATAAITTPPLKRRSFSAPCPKLMFDMCSSPAQDTPLDVVWITRMFPWSCTYFRDISTERYKNTSIVCTKTTDRHKHVFTAGVSLSQFIN